MYIYTNIVNPTVHISYFTVLHFNQDRNTFLILINSNYRERIIEGLQEQTK